MSVLWPYEDVQSSNNKQEIDNLKKKVDSLANVAAKVNVDNRFTVNQTIPSVLLQDQIIFKNGNDVTGSIRKTNNGNDLNIEVGNGKLILSGTEISANNKKITNVAPPIALTDAMRKADVSYTRIKDEGTNTPPNSTFTSNFMNVDSLYNFEVRFAFDNHNMIANFKLRKNGNNPAYSPIFYFPQDPNDPFGSFWQFAFKFDGNRTFTIYTQRNLNYCSVWCYREF